MCVCVCVLLLVPFYWFAERPIFKLTTFVPKHWPRNATHAHSHTHKDTLGLFALEMALPVAIAFSIAYFCAFSDKLKEKAKVSAKKTQFLVYNSIYNIICMCVYIMHTYNYRQASNFDTYNFFGIFGLLLSSIYFPLLFCCLTAAICS